ncbi:hypothetical protein JCM6882_001098 [Rhodosporidiobolus microsporus]
MSVPGPHWLRIRSVVLHYKHRKDPPPLDIRGSVCTGIIWKAVVLTLEEAHESGAQPSPADIAHEERLSASAERLQAEFVNLPGAKEMHDAIDNVFSFIYNLSVDADEHSSESWGHATIAAKWKEVKDIKLYQLHLLQTDLAINVLHHIYDPALQHGADRTTLTSMGLNVDRRPPGRGQSVERRPSEGSVEREMGKRAGGRRGLPLERMGYRQRFQYAGAY